MIYSTVTNYEKLSCQGVSQEGKKFCVLYELGNKMWLGVWGTLWARSGFNGGPEGKAHGKLTIFSLKLVWYSLLEIIKLKLFNKKLLL